MSPGSDQQLFEQRLAAWRSEAEELTRLAKRYPEVVAQQDIKSQLLLSYIQTWMREPIQLRVMGSRR